MRTFGIKCHEGGIMPCLETKHLEDFLRNASHYDATVAHLSAGCHDCAVKLVQLATSETRDDLRRVFFKRLEALGVVSSKCVEPAIGASLHAKAAEDNWNTFTEEQRSHVEACNACRTEFDDLRAFHNVLDEFTISDPLDACASEDMLREFLFNADHYDRIVGHVVDYGCKVCAAALVRLYGEVKDERRSVLAKRLSRLGILESQGEKQPVTNEGSADSIREEFAIPWGAAS
jgi:hypothetical protein